MERFVHRKGNKSNCFVILGSDEEGGSENEGSGSGSGSGSDGEGEGGEEQENEGNVEKF